MSILEAVLAGIGKDAAVEAASANRYWIAVQSRYCGLASTLGSTDLPDARYVGAGSLAGRSALELARLSLSDDPLDAALGMAAINSLLELDESRCDERNGRDILFERGTGRRVALVGHFPFVPELQEAAKHLSVLELRPRPGDLPASEAPAVLENAEAVAITGTAFVNHTIELLLGYCRPDAFVLVIGPTAPLSAAVFDYGVDAIAGARVSDPALVLRQIAEGTIFRQLEGVRRVTFWGSRP